MNLNKVFILGRLTADPQVRSTTSGQQVATFALATNRVWNDRNNQKQESTEYHNVVVWGRQADVAGKYLIKGSLVLIEGRLQTRAWDDKQGQKRRTTEIIAERLQLGPRPAGSGGGFSGPSQQSQRSEESPQPHEEIPTIDVDSEISPEDLPF
ncbi:MAG: single-stranded DNA-binding protein [Candidatus Harrisonbacteria bacterium CG10_big_fil_rev_8_21_14_0_10_40_38]|uniref:Single-stranded DNA-binding protein n=1 Tax=Candidatus Harrisonbacteria bacterium CG10_big_fil_rev_8_21_14_0_10_40_38 TaxID=1974583 RepID=A0A2H0US45_9BACT|nr:MAG: single-stranded DNA-binding protein [Candidatus Harrisonbacteria bacterium CG10_big_fil_rev_8_21_14_0_10_40_38]